MKYKQICKEEATIYIIPTDFISSQERVLDLSFCYISRGNRRTQADVA